MRVTFVISSLSGGGAERVLSCLANFLAGQNWEITLITLGSSRNDSFQLNSKILRVELDAVIESSFIVQAILNNLNRILKLRRAIRNSQPDIVISFLDQINILTLFATRRLGIKVVVSERTHPKFHNIGRIWSWLRKMTYPWANAIVVQTEEVKKWIINELKIYQNIFIIQNPINNPNKTTSDNEKKLADIIGDNKHTRTIVGLGRLAFVKGFDILIKSFALATSGNDQWRLVILGEGDERKRLIEIARDLGVSERVFLPGFVDSPMSFLEQADIFVLSSRYEGFPNALLESMACGISVISFNCPSGPSDIIINGNNGLLVPPEDVYALADAMRQLIENETRRRNLGLHAKEVSHRFRIDKIAENWEKVISEC